MSKEKSTKHQMLTDKDQSPTNQISKKYKWFFAVLVSLPMIFLIVLEIFLRMINYGYNFDQWVSIEEDRQVLNQDIGRKYFTSGAFNPTTSEDKFDIHKKSDAFRVFVLGGSSAEGFPYSPLGSFSRYIRRRLELVYPHTKIEVINLGMTAVNSYTIIDLLPGVLNQKPDLILIYAGHNEYYGALGVGSVQSLGSSRALIRIMLFLNEFRTIQLIRNSIQRSVSLFARGEDTFSGTLMSRMAKDKYIPFKSKKFDAGLQQYNKNLMDILQLAKDKNVPVILGRLASNLKDQKPFISVDTPDYKTADQVYKEAEDAFKADHFAKADSLFKLAKDLDVLRYRAPEKMNEIINTLGEEFQVPIVPIDSIFGSVSPGGIAGDNLFVDHLHPNVRGYQLIGKAFYERMEKEKYLPRSEKAEIPFNEQDSLTRAKFVFTKLDSVIGNDQITLLKNNWPYVKERVDVSKFQPEDFQKLFQPKDFIDSLAMFRIENKVSWVDAHFIAATYYLRKDDLKEYLKHTNVLIYQYPSFNDLDGVITYFYEKKKLNLADYTPKRNGIMALYIGNFDNAIRHLTEAYQADPKDPMVFYHLSLAYSKKEDFKRALIAINQCLIVDPKYPEAKKLKQYILNQFKN